MRRQWEAQKPLSERLKVHSSASAAGVESSSSLDLIPPQLLRRYVAYARKYVHPRITPDCAKVLTCRAMREYCASVPDGMREYYALLCVTSVLRY